MDEWSAVLYNTHAAIDCEARGRERRDGATVNGDGAHRRGEESS